MARLSSIEQATRTVPMDLGPDRIHVTYRLGAVNKRFARWLEEHAEDENSGYEMFARVVASWDVENDEGEVIPVTVEGLEANDVSALLLAEILKGIFGDASPDPKKPR